MSSYKKLVLYVSALCLMPTKQIITSQDVARLKLKIFDLQLEVKRLERLREENPQYKEKYRDLQFEFLKEHVADIVQLQFLKSGPSLPQKMIPAAVELLQEQTITQPESEPETLDLALNSKQFKQFKRKNTQFKEKNRTRGFQYPKKRIDEFLQLQTLRNNALASMKEHSGTSHINHLERKIRRQGHQLAKYYMKSKSNNQYPHKHGQRKGKHIDRNQSKIHLMDDCQ